MSYCKYLTDKKRCVLIKQITGRNYHPLRKSCEKKCAPNDFERAPILLWRRFEEQKRKIKEAREKADAPPDKEQVSAAEQNRRWEICEKECGDDKCLCHNRLRKKIIYGDCDKFRR